MKALRTIVAAVLVGVFLAGCASTRAVEGPQEINDPFEPFNRLMFNSTLRFDRFVLRPTAIVYRAVFPEPIRNGVRNFLNNLDSPVIFTNDLLQGELARAKITFVRTVVNTTVGIGGLFDVADRWGFPRHREDFGQTLATLGIGEGPYLFIPLFGPANPRDLFGYGTDLFFQPLTYVQWGDESYVPVADTASIFSIWARGISRRWMRSNRFRWISTRRFEVSTARAATTRSTTGRPRSRIYQISRAWLLQLAQMA
jgi:phospholipid-binding lipoprotein MlaA